MNSNQLIYEKSPYLLEHAMQPVHWFPWCEDAFEIAKKENKPIFLSIGYSSCHWCHVMARESFEDDEVARILNEHYVSIKVDREERPDIDAIYMRVCIAVNGSGGWPLTVVMTPNQKPFFVGTYIPRENLNQKAGLIYLLKLLAKRWETDKEGITDIGNRIEAFFEQEEFFRPNIDEFILTKDTLNEVTNDYLSSLDKEFGGFIGEPKFPPFTVLRYLIRARKNNEKKDEEIENMIDLTLHAMASGGLYDQIEGGFFRYATDEQWLIPHFEKMLYDNALAIITYLEASVASSRRENQVIYLRIAKETLAFLIKHFHEPGQGFYASSNADVEGEEGAYYLFTSSEINEHFPQFRDFIKTFNIEEDGMIDGKSLPHYKNIQLKRKGYSSNVLKELADYRQSRMRLSIDRKIITVWNCLMVIALVRYYQVNEKDKARDEYLTIASNILQFIEERIINSHGRLGTSFIDGRVSGDGFLDDYAYLSYAYYEIYEATGEAEYLERLISTLDLTIEHFFDHQEGGFYLSADFSEKLLFRPKEVSDSSIPSSNSVLLFLLQKIMHLVPNGYYYDIYELQLKYIKKTLADNPTMSAFALFPFQKEVTPGLTVIYRTKNNFYKRILKIANRNFLNENNFLILSRHNNRILNRITDYDKVYPLIDNKGTFYICTNESCLAPIHDIETVNQMVSANANRT